jgi:hypothetical protein
MRIGYLTYHPDDSKGSADRPATKGAAEATPDASEITPAMIEAGVAEMARHYLGLAEADPETERVAVAAIFLKMREVQNKSAL